MQPHSLAKNTVVLPSITTSSLVTSMVNKEVKINAYAKLHR